MTTIADRECLKAAHDAGMNAWRPWSGVYGRAARLCKNGLLLKAGISAMPPHVVYVLSPLGAEELEVAMRVATPSADRESDQDNPT